MNRIVSTLGRTADLEQALRTALSEALEQIGIAAGAIVVRDLPGWPDPLAIGQGVADALLHSPTVMGMLGQAHGALAGQPGQMVRMEGSAVPELLADAVYKACLGDVAVIAVPVQDGPRADIILFGHPELQISEDQAQFLSTFAASVGWAIERTEQDELRSAVRVHDALQHMQSRLLADISHQFRSPLGLIGLACQSLQATDVQFTSEHRQCFLQIIEQATEELVGLVIELALPLVAGEEGN